MMFLMSCLIPLALSSYYGVMQGDEANYVRSKDAWFFIYLKK